MHELRVLLGNGAPPRAQEPRVDHGSWHGMHLPGSDHGPAAAAAVAPGASGKNPSRIPHVIICCRPESHGRLALSRGPPPQARSLPPGAVTGGAALRFV